jgi:hypothetical protein
MNQPNAPMPDLTKRLLPLVVGVTGHRDLRQEDLLALEKTVYLIFDELAAAYPSTPLVLLSPLAEGADRLAARVALSWEDKGAVKPEDKRKVRLIVPLPMRQDYYENDFPDTVDEFRSLLGQAGFSFSLTAASEEPASGAARDAQYAYVGAYVARHCQILIALWDGKGTAKTGGTAQVVNFKLTGELDSSAPACTIEQPETGPVYHIITPRKSNPFKLEDPPTVNRYYPVVNTEGLLEARTDATSASLYTSVYEHTDVYNQDAKRLGPALLAHVPYPLFPEPDYKLTRALQRDLDRYTLADALAVRFQTRAREALVFLLWLALTAALLFYLQHAADWFYHRIYREAQTTITLTRGGPKFEALAIPYLVMLIIAFVAYWWEKKQRFHSKYLDYRALAEGLRVQFFWRLAGLHVSVAEHYLRKQKGHLDWIRLALRVGCFPERPDEPYLDHEPGAHELRLVLKHWVEHQLDFFQRTAKKNDRASRKYHNFERLAFSIGIGSSIFKVLLTYNHPLITLMIIMLFVAALLSIYVKILALSEHAKQYAWMSIQFARARNCLVRLVYPDEGTRARELASDSDVEAQRLKKARELVLDLGREALAENGDWVLLHRDRPLELPRI